ncbi:hypothetical protein DV735_g2402, partial [Chaetothyriales sp. CBS 134920]
MLSPSPSLANPTPEGANLHPTSPRRRALSYLRHLSQNRTSPTSPAERASPRSSFVRSISNSEPRARPGQSLVPGSHRHSRPDECTGTITGTTASLQQITNEPQGQVPTQLAATDSTHPATSVSPTTDAFRPETTAAETTNSDDQGSDMMGPTTASPIPDALARTASSGTEPARVLTATGEGDRDEGEKQSQLPTIRFFPHHDIRSSGRQSLNFAPISRTLPNEQSVIRVGRYSEREGIPTANPTAPSDAPVGFKSKVVSRKHCEFTFLSGQWYIKDVASSSGTFLNHIRLSQPNTESRQFPIKDGDIVQLGIDFRGGEEMIFRCVKIRIECNRAWQKKPNTFNHVNHFSSHHALMSGTTNAYARSWKERTAYIRNSNAPTSDMDEWMGNTDSAPAAETPTRAHAAAEAQPDQQHAITAPSTDSDESVEEGSSAPRTAAGLLARRQATNPGSPQLQAVNPIEIRAVGDGEPSTPGPANPPCRVTPDAAERPNAGEGPLTPRNNAGPFVFDGGAAAREKYQGISDGSSVNDLREAALWVEQSTHRPLETGYSTAHLSLFMDVQLYVYDLSGGLARQYSQALIGQHIEAVYHTAIVVNNVEYFFGQGIHRKIPGSTHHGRPMRIVQLGKTHLTPDTIEEYIVSLESVYTPESYDLFLHNCNSFSQDLSVFLVGKSIPEEITSLPETFLRTPIGQMLRGQIDQSMRAMVQAPDAASGTNAAARPVAAQEAAHSVAKPTMSTKNGAESAEFSNGRSPPHQPGQVWTITELGVLNKLLKQAESSCAVIFFTSATCAPCKICYAPYDELAQEAGSKATLIKVDVNSAYAIGSRYRIRATPTFMTFLKGQKYEEWSGADPSRLRGSVQMLVQMSQPQHVHFQLKTPSFHGLIRKPIMYTKIPPLDKLAAKLGPFAQDRSIRELIAFINATTSGSHGSATANAGLPGLPSLSAYLSTEYQKVPLASRFALVDLIRVAAIDSRVSSFLATEPSLRTLSTLLTQADGGWGAAPFQLRLVTCQLACNLFSSPVFQDLVSQPSSTLRTYLESMSDCLIAPDNANARSAAAAVFYNLAAINHNERVQGRPDKFEISEDVEAALTSAAFNEHESKDSLRSQLLALGLLLYAVNEPSESTVWQLCDSLDLNECLKAKAKDPVFKGDNAVLLEVRELLSSDDGATKEASWALSTSVETIQQLSSSGLDAQNKRNKKKNPLDKASELAGEAAKNEGTGQNRQGETRK